MFTLDYSIPLKALEISVSIRSYRDIWTTSKGGLLQLEMLGNTPWFWSIGPKFTVPFYCGKDYSARMDRFILQKFVRLVGLWKWVSTDNKSIDSVKQSVRDSQKESGRFAASHFVNKSKTIRYNTYSRESDNVAILDLAERYWM